MHPPPPPSPSVQALPPARRLDAQALQDFAALLPPNARALRRQLGDDAALLLLLNSLPGAQLPIPKHPHANVHGARRWARYAELLGEPAMQALAAHWGGTLLDVPVCAQVLDAVRDRWLRARFDALTAPAPQGPALSAYAALGELCEALAGAGQPLTFRHVQVIVNRSDDELPDGQADLFGG